MHQNYHFLKRLVAHLKKELVGQRLVVCFSQNKDELIFGFVGDRGETYVRADLSHNRGILTFPTDFKRALKNSVDLFDELIDQRILDVQGHLNERSFQVLFENQLTLVFKLFGRQSNILLYGEQPPPALFKKRIEKDLQLELKAFNRPIDQSLKAFIQNEADVRSTFPTLGPLVMKHLEERGLHTLDPEGQWQLITRVLQEMDNSSYYVILEGEHPRLSLIPHGEVLEEFDSPVDCLNEFYRQLIQRETLGLEKGKVIKMLEKKITRSGNYSIKLREKIEELAAKRYDRTGDIIMANLHQIDVSSGEAELFDFYNNQMVTVKLNPKLTPQKNAEKFYRKSKNQHIEVQKLQSNLQMSEQELHQSEELLALIQEVSDLKSLRKLIKTEQAKPKSTEELPFHQFSVGEFQVLVGKSAKGNDQLTQNYTHKNDLWFHARDVAGSHVVLKYRSGHSFAPALIERVAQIAAWHSKGKNFPLCPVIYTEKKYVRKPKGFAPGMVKLDREEVILVEPKKFDPLAED